MLIEHQHLLSVLACYNI